MPKTTPARPRWDPSWGCPRFAYDDADDCDGWALDDDYAALLYATVPSRASREDIDDRWYPAWAVALAARLFDDWYEGDGWRSGDAVALAKMRPVFEHIRDDPGFRAALVGAYALGADTAAVRLCKAYRRRIARKLAR